MAIIDKYATEKGACSEINWFKVWDIAIILSSNAYIALQISKVACPISF